MKKILMISYHTCPLAQKEGKETGGMNVYVYELSRNLARLGHKVDVITRCQDKSNQNIVEVEKNFRVIHLVAGPTTPIHKKKLIVYISEFVNSVQAFICDEQIQYDLIHAHYYQSGIIGLELKKAQKAPLIMTFHTLALMKNLVARRPSEQEDTVRISDEFKLVRGADAIITPSATDREYLKYLYTADPSKIFEIPPGVNTHLFTPIKKSLAKKKIGRREDEKILLFVGRVEPLKGIDVLLYAMKILHAQEQHIPIRLLIVGGDISQDRRAWSQELARLEELRHTLGMQEAVEFVGQRPQHELPYYYNAAEVVVMPSHYESFGMVAAEAMACATPVITTNVAGISNLIDDARPTLITTVNNPLLLASQIRRLLTDKEMYRQIQKNILVNIKELDWSVVVKQIEQVYQRIA